MFFFKKCFRPARHKHYSISFCLHKTSLMSPTGFLEINCLHHMFWEPFSLIFPVQIRRFLEKKYSNTSQNSNSNQTSTSSDDGAFNSPVFRMDPIVSKQQDKVK